MKRLTIAAAIAFAALIAAASGPLAISSAEETGASSPLPDSSGLHTLIAEALANNPELKAARESAAAMRGRIRSEAGFEDPTLKVEMEEFSRQNPLPLTPGNAMLTRYTITQALPFPGKLRLKEEIAGREADGSTYALRAREIEVVRMVKEAAFEMAYIDETLKVYGEVRGILKEAAAAAEALYSTGRAPQLDAVRSAVEITMLDDSVIAAEAERQVATARLKSLIGRPQDAALTETAALPETIAVPDAASLIERALAESPDVKLSEKESEAAALRSDLSSRTRYPDFMVGAGPVQRDGRFDSFDVMLQVSLPIWGEKNSGRVDEGRAQAASARAMTTAARNKKALEVKSAAIRAEASARELKLFDSGIVPQSETALESAMKGYQAGRGAFTSVAEAARTLRKARLDRLKAALDYATRLAALEAAVGGGLR